MRVKVICIFFNVFVVNVEAMWWLPLLLVVNDYYDDEVIGSVSTLGTSARTFDSCRK